MEVTNCRAGGNDQKSKNNGKKLWRYGILCLCICVCIYVYMYIIQFDFCIMAVVPCSSNIYHVRCYRQDTQSVHLCAGHGFFQEPFCHDGQHDARHEEQNGGYAQKLCKCHDCAAPSVCFICVVMSFSLNSVSGQCAVRLQHACIQLLLSHDLL